MFKFYIKQRLESWSLYKTKVYKFKDFLLKVELIFYV